MNEVFYQKLQNLLRQDQIRIEEPLANHTTFKIGGPASTLILPETVEQITKTIKLCDEYNIPHFIMGNGSNLLVSDSGFPGTVIKLDKQFGKITIQDGIVSAQAGVHLSRLADEIAENGLTGFEFASGIPGTLGGAVTMNAGAYGGEMKQVLLNATILNQAGDIMVLNNEELKLGYRKSIIQENHLIVLEASFAFEYGDKQEIRNTIMDLNARRREKQPLECPSAGSTFKRPEGYFAGKLIMDSGLRGYQVGGAKISDKHCGFVINNGGATAKDVKTLITDVIRIVYDKYGVVLEPEVKLLGEF